MYMYLLFMPVVIFSDWLKACLILNCKYWWYLLFMLTFFSLIGWTFHLFYDWLVICSVVDINITFHADFLLSDWLRSCLMINYNFWSYLLSKQPCLFSDLVHVTWSTVNIYVYQEWGDILIKVVYLYTHSGWQCDTVCKLLAWLSPNLSAITSRSTSVIIHPAKLCLIIHSTKLSFRGVYCFHIHLSIHPSFCLSITFWFFPDILKSQRCKF